MPQPITSIRVATWRRVSVVFVLVGQIYWCCKSAFTGLQLSWEVQWEEVGGAVGGGGRRSGRRWEVQWEEVGGAVA